jgi:hypothetical protein
VLPLDALVLVLTLVDRQQRIADPNEMLLKYALKVTQCQTRETLDDPNRCEV